MPDGKVVIVTPVPVLKQQCYYLKRLLHIELCCMRLCTCLIPFKRFLILPELSLAHNNNL